MATFSLQSLSQLKDASGVPPVFADQSDQLCVYGATRSHGQPIFLRHDISFPINQITGQD